MCAVWPILGGPDEAVVGGEGGEGGVGGGGPAAPGGGCARSAESRVHRAWSRWLVIRRFVMCGDARTIASISSVSKRHSAHLCLEQDRIKSYA